MDKYAPEDIPNISSTCFKLNSLQLQALLQNYHCAPDEPFIPTVRAAQRPPWSTCTDGGGGGGEAKENSLMVSFHFKNKLIYLTVCTIMFAVDA